MAKAYYSSVFEQSAGELWKENCPGVRRTVRDLRLRPCQTRRIAGNAAALVCEMESLRDAMAA